MTGVYLKRKWINTWPGNWNTYEGGTNVGTVEPDRLGGYVWLARKLPGAKWQRARTVDEAKAACEAALDAGKVTP